MDPFMRLLVCECGYHWRLRVNTCAKVDGVHHPQGKESECMSHCHDALYITVWEYYILAVHRDCHNLEYMGSNTSVRAIHFGKTLCDCEFHVARTIDYIPPPSFLYPLSIYWRSRESHNIVNGCFSTWGLTLCTTLHIVCLQFLCDVFVYQSTCA